MKLTRIVHLPTGLDMTFGCGETTSASEFGALSEAAAFQANPDTPGLPDLGLDERNTRSCPLGFGQS